MSFEGEKKFPGLGFTTPAPENDLKFGATEGSAAEEVDIEPLLPDPDEVKKAAKKADTDRRNCRSY